MRGLVKSETSAIKKPAVKQFSEDVQNRSSIRHLDTREANNFRSKHSNSDIEFNKLVLENKDNLHVFGIGILTGNSRIVS